MSPDADADGGHGRPCSAAWQAAAYGVWIVDHFSQWMPELLVENPSMFPVVPLVIASGNFLNGGSWLILVLWTSSSS